MQFSRNRLPRPAGVDRCDSGDYRPYVDTICWTFSGMHRPDGAFGGKTRIQRKDLHCTSDGTGSVHGKHQESYFDDGVRIESTFTGQMIIKLVE